MILENLVKKVKGDVTTLALVGLLGVGAITGTTESYGMVPQSQRDIATAGKILKESGPKLAGKLGSILESWALLGHREKVAREGSSQININQSGQRIVSEGVNYGNGRYRLEKGYVWVNPEDPNDFEVKKVMGSGFSFRWVDYDNSGGVNNWVELIERKKRFKSNESIAVILIYESEKPFRQNMKLYAPSGMIIEEYDIDPYKERDLITVYNIEGKKFSFVVESKYDKGGYTPKNSGIVMGLDRERIRDLLKRYTEGEFSAVFRVDGKIKDSVAFDLIH